MIMNKIVYMSVEEGFEKTPVDKKYETSRLVMELLNARPDVDLVLVHPGDYNLNDGSINRAFDFVNPTTIKQSKSSHFPSGDMFIIYGDETSKNAGLDFGRNQYSFLKNLKQNNSFSYFFNEPETEELTLKDGLIKLSIDDSLPVAKTVYFDSFDQTKELINQYGSIIIKPIFGCAGAGVNKLSLIEDIFNLDVSENDLQGNYVLQEPLFGDETRITLLDGKFLWSMRHQNRSAPWAKNEKHSSNFYQPNEEELNSARKISDAVGAYLIGVDFIGTKVNEINGTGTGMSRNYKGGSPILDLHANKFVERIISTVYGGLK